MAKYTVKPTTAQRQNIILLARHLRDLVGTPAADKYSHHSVASCTVGVAIRSKLFPLFNEHAYVKPTGAVDTNRNSRFSDVSDVARELFGNDYYDKVIYGGDSSGLTVYTLDDGAQQLECVANYIIKRYQISDAALNKAVMPTVVTKTVEVDTTKAKIVEKIAANEKFIAHCVAVLDRVISSSVQDAKDEAIIENRLLRQFV